MSLVKLNARSATALDATVLTGNLPAISGASLTGLSTTIPSQIFRLSSSFTGSVNPIANNWEEVDTDEYGAVGSYVSQSSGKFKFSSTGFYRIEFILVNNGNADNRTIYCNIRTSTNDGSSYGLATETGGFLQPTSGSSSRYTSYATHQIDVTDTTNQAVCFSVAHQGGASSTETSGISTYSHTHAVFTRLGDT